MPSPRSIYTSIARSISPEGQYELDERGQARRVWNFPTPEGVQQLDKVIQEGLQAPGATYEAVLRDLRVSGRPLDPSLREAARQLQEARRQRLLLPGDELR